MTKSIFIIFFISLVAFLIFAQRNDEKNQCDGKTKIYVSMGKAYSCNNFKKSVND